MPSEEIDMSKKAQPTIKGKAEHILVQYSQQDQNDDGMQLIKRTEPEIQVDARQEKILMRTERFLGPNML